MVCLVSVLLIILTSFLLFIYVHMCVDMCMCLVGMQVHQHMWACAHASQRWILRGSLPKFLFFFYFLGQTILLNLQQTKSGYPCLNLLSNRIMIMTPFYLFLFFIFSTFYFYHECWRSNIGPHIWMANSLPMEPCLWPMISFLKSNYKRMQLVILYFTIRR